MALSLRELFMKLVQQVREVACGKRYYLIMHAITPFY